MDNALHYGKQVDKPPTKLSLKKDMLEYLRRLGVPREKGMGKFTLFSLVKKIRPKEKVYHIDMLFAAHGHTSIRLPPYMCDLNPIELAWRQSKDYVRSHNTAGDISLRRLQELVQEAIKGVTKED
jgi:transposase